MIMRDRSSEVLAASVFDFAEFLKDNSLIGGDHITQLKDDILFIRTSNPPVQFGVTDDFKKWKTLKLRNRTERFHWNTVQ